MRALIIGGGVAGTVAAMALHKAGWEPVVYEAYQESAGLEQGSYLTVAVNGLDALRAVDAHAVVTGAGFPSGKIEFYSAAGKRLGAMAMGPVLDDGTVTHTIRRSDLYDGLYREVVRRGIAVEHGKRLTGAVTAPGGRVIARFADGSTAAGDVLVGADGVHSATRGIIDPGAPGPRYTGLGNVGGFTRGVRISARPGDYVMVWGKDCFFGYTVSPDGEIWWFANPPSRTEIPRDQLGRLTTGQLRERLVALLSSDKTPGAQIVSSAAPGFRLTNQYDLPEVPAWHNESMVIIGDAAHAVSPASGQGASLAAEDAVTLALCLRDAPSVPAALDGYEQQRRARVQRVVAWGSSMNNTKKQGLAGRMLRDIALPIILKKAARPGEIDKIAWLFAHHITWTEPASV
jgi:2-polyprenyl-6-methoxyphenol hydroxylase-like FAD-dependent oxidoreductase